LIRNATKGHVTNGFLNFRIKVEEGIEAHAELSFDLLATSFKDVHGDSGFISVFEGDWSVAHLCYLVGWQQPHSIDQR
jgi:hypothetical protein